MEQTTRILPAEPSPSALAAMLLAFPREHIEALAEALVTTLDVMDGDTDREPNGDELDGTAGEDDFVWHGENWKGEPGCPISDPDLAVDDGGCDEVDGEREPEEFIGEFCDPDVRAGHRRRIQLSRCMPRYRYLRDWRTGKVHGRELLQYELLHDPVLPNRRGLLRRKRGVPRTPRP